MLKSFLARSLTTTDTQKAKASFLSRINMVALLGVASDADGVAGDPIKAMGLLFPNPVGLAEGFNTDARNVGATGALGFGFIEVGPVSINGSQEPYQARSDFKAKQIIESGHRPIASLEAFLSNAKSIHPFHARGGVTGVSIAEPDVANIREFAQSVAPFADYLSVAPEVTNLEIETVKTYFEALADFRHEYAKATGKDIKLVAKVSGSTSNDRILAVLEAALKSGFDAVTAAGFATDTKGVVGDKRKARLGEIISLIKNHVPTDFCVIASGRMLSSKDAADALVAGATLVQIHSGLIFNGPDFISQTVAHLAQVRKTQNGRLKSQMPQVF